MFNQRLKLARQAAGLSLRGLEERVGNQVSAQAIGKYERGEMRPSSDVLIALARALGVTESYLLSQGNIELEEVEFRKNNTTSKKEESQVTAAVMDWVGRYLEIEELLQLSSIEWEQPRGIPYPVHELADAEANAELIRERWNLGADPIPNLAEFLEERGIKIIMLSLPEKVSGMTCWVRRKKGNRVPVIVVNADHKGERKRFTLAHELGHMVQRLQESSDDEKAEKAANRFAGAFLMPKAIIWSEIGTHRTALSLGELFDLKKLFGASVMSITHRCHDLFIINDTTFKQLNDKFSEWRKPPYAEPNEVVDNDPSRFRRLCFRALAEGAISDSKAAELLGMTVRELDREMDAREMFVQSKATKEAVAH